jgi:hypothetical protein
MINIFQNTKQYSFPQRSQLSLPSLALRETADFNHQGWQVLPAAPRVEDDDARFPKNLMNFRLKHVQFIIRIHSFNPAFKRFLSNIYFSHISLLLKQTIVHHF